MEDGRLYNAYLVCSLLGISPREYYQAKAGEQIILQAFAHRALEEKGQKPRWL